MSSKVYLNSVSSLIEAGLSNSEITGSLHMSDVVVNPHVKKLVNKTIIIDIPTDLDYNLLSECNKITSRFPIDCDNYKLEEFDKQENVIEVDKSEMSYLILNKYMLEDVGNFDLIKSEKFILGTNPITNGSKNLIGHILEKFKLKED